MTKKNEEGTDLSITLGAKKNWKKTNFKIANQEQDIHINRAKYIIFYAEFELKEEDTLRTENVAYAIYKRVVK